MKPGFWRDLTLAHGDILPEPEADWFSFKKNYFDGCPIVKITSENFPDALEAVTRAAEIAGIPKPPVYIALPHEEKGFYTRNDTTITNNNGAITFAYGDVKGKTIDEIQAVALHEIGHGFQGKDAAKSQALYDESLGHMKRAVSAGNLFHAKESLTAGLIAGGVAALGLLSAPVAVAGLVTYFALAATTSLCGTLAAASCLMERQQINHQREFDADRFSILNADNPEIAVKLLQEGVKERKADDAQAETTLGWAAKLAVNAFSREDFTQTMGELSRSNHPDPEKRASFAEKVLAERNAQKGRKGEIDFP